MPLTVLFFAVLEYLAYGLLACVALALAFLMVAIIAAARAASRYDDEAGMDAYGDVPNVPADHGKHAA